MIDSFSTDPDVEKEFENRMKNETKVDFMGKVTHFLELRFQWKRTKNGVKVHMPQEAFADNLIEAAGLKPSSSTYMTPFRSGCPVDSIPQNSSTDELSATMRSYVGSLLWLSMGIRPDLSTITNILTKHQAYPTQRHIDAVKYVIKYLKGTKNLGIQLDRNSDDSTNIQSFLNFPVNSSKIKALTDANWGLQDQSVPKPNATPQHLGLYKSRSISAGYIVTLHGPIHWVSKRQSITARSSTETEIYATDECVKHLLHLHNIINGLQLAPQLLQDKIQIFNYNMACVQWTSNKTIKGLVTLYTNS